MSPNLDVHRQSALPALHRRPRRLQAAHLRSYRTRRAPDLPAICTSAPPARTVMSAQIEAGFKVMLDEMNRVWREFFPADPPARSGAPPAASFPARRGLIPWLPFAVTGYNLCLSRFACCPVFRRKFAGEYPHWLLRASASLIWSTTCPSVSRAAFRLQQISSGHPPPTVTPFADPDRSLTTGQMRQISRRCRQPRSNGRICPQAAADRISIPVVHDALT